MFIGTNNDQLPFSSIGVPLKLYFSIAPSTVLLIASILPGPVTTSFILPISLAGLQFLFKESFSSSVKTLPIKIAVGTNSKLLIEISYLLIPNALPTLKLSHQ